MSESADKVLVDRKDLEELLLLVGDDLWTDAPECCKSVRRAQTLGRKLWKKLSKPRRDCDDSHL